MNMEKKLYRAGLGVAGSLALALVGTTANAATWSDASVHYEYGTHFAEPGYSQPIKKNIVGFTYAGGDAWGTNFFNMDVLMSDRGDPEACSNGLACSAAGAQEIYAVYRRTWSYTTITGDKIELGPINDIKMAFGVDLGTKNTTFGPKDQKVRFGPMVGLDVPAGYAEVGVELYKEKNHNGLTPYALANKAPGGDVTFDTTYVIAADWGIPIASTGLEWSGFFDYIGTKGFGTVPETLLSTQVMYGIGELVGSKKKSLQVGLEYQYWHNKFGNSADSTPGTKASTPMLRVDYHF